jgi:hypothetical protein
MTEQITFSQPLSPRRKPYKISAALLVAEKSQNPVILSAGFGRRIPLKLLF